MDVDAVGSEQPVLMQKPDWIGPSAPHAAANASIGDDAQIELPGQSPVMNPDLTLHELGRARAERQADPGTAVRKQTAQPHHVVRMISIAVGPPASCFFVVGTAVGKYGADSRCPERGDGGIRMLGAVHDVAPVKHGRNAAIQRLDGAGQRRRIDVLGTIERNERFAQLVSVFGRDEIRAHAAQRGLPEMPVAINQSRHDDRVRCVDDFATWRHAALAGGRYGNDVFSADPDISTWTHLAQGMTGDNGSSGKHLCWQTCCRHWRVFPMMLTFLFDDAHPIPSSGIRLSATG